MARMRFCTAVICCSYNLRPPGLLWDGCRGGDRAKRGSSNPPVGRTKVRGHVSPTEPRSAKRARVTPFGSLHRPSFASSSPYGARIMSRTETGFSRQLAPLGILSGRRGLFCRSGGTVSVGDCPTAPPRARIGPLHLLDQMPGRIQRSDHGCLCDRADSAGGGRRRASHDRAGPRPVRPILYPEKLVADNIWGSAETPGWLVKGEGIGRSRPSTWWNLRESRLRSSVRQPRFLC